MSTLLIGLTGRARSGKTTAAKHLIHMHGMIHYAFAMPLKGMLANGFNLTDAHLEGRLKEQPLPWLGKSPRELLQTLGTEWDRGLVHGDLWLLLAEQNLHNLASLLPEAPGAVISDVRFENEAEFIRQRGGVVIHIQRPNAPGVAAHSSEAGIAIHDNDLVIHNDGELADLFNHIEQALDMVRARATRRAA